MVWRKGAGDRPFLLSGCLPEPLWPSGAAGRICLHAPIDRAQMSEAGHLGGCADASFR